MRCVLLLSVAVLLSACPGREPTPECTYPQCDMPWDVTEDWGSDACPAYQSVGCSSETGSIARCESGQLATSTWDSELITYGDCAAKGLTCSERRFTVVHANGTTGHAVYEARCEGLQPIAQPGTPCRDVGELGCGADGKGAVQCTESGWEPIDAPCPTAS